MDEEIVQKVAPVTQAVANLLNVIECEPNKWHNFQVTFKKTSEGRILIADSFNLMRVEPFWTERVFMELCPLHYQSWCERNG